MQGRGTLAVRRPRSGLRWQRVHIGFDLAGASALAGPAGGTDATLLLMHPLPTEASSHPAQKAMATDIMDLWISFIQDG